MEETRRISDRPKPPPRSPRVRAFAAAVLLLAIASLLLAMLAGLGSRWEWWHFRTGFSLLRWAVYGAIAVIPLGLLAFVLAGRRAGRADLVIAAVAVMIAVLLVVNAWQWRKRGANVPPIHDITTDVNDPPEFVAIAPLRAAAPNPVEYAGEETAAHQLAAYPDIQPLELPLPVPAAFERARDAARRMGWEIVAVEPAEGRIEATDRTRWFGFRDDVVIRVSARQGGEAGSRIDVRSKSRVGRGDVGTNARRIRAYLRRVERMS
jgi:uncharacterized protein (DUF1499 family)